MTRRRSRSTSDRDARRRELLDAADRAIRRDGARVSMDAIATEAGITKPILYRHFGDKGGMYEALANRHVNRLMRTLDEVLADADDPRRQLQATIDAYLALIETEPELYRFLMHRAIAERPETARAITDFTHQLAGRIAVVLRDELPRLGADSGPAEPYAHGLIGMIQQAGEWWLSSRSMSREQLVDVLVRLLWQGFAGLPDAPG